MKTQQTIAIFYHGEETKPNLVATDNGVTGVIRIGAQVELYFSSAKSARSLATELNRLANDIEGGQ